MVGSYWGFGGAAAQMMRSANELLAQKSSLLVPSHGEVVHDAQGAVILLQTRLDAVMSNYFSLAAWRHYAQMGIPAFKKGDTAPQVAMRTPLPPIELPKWLQKVPWTATSYGLIAEDKSMFLLDCGFSELVLDALAKMAAAGRFTEIDAIWIAHYHDDHNASVNAVRGIYGSRVYVQKELVDIFDNPRAYCMPATFTESIHIDHVLSEGEHSSGKGSNSPLIYFPGQTIYHDGLLIERDGMRVFMSGDSFANWGIDDYCSYNRNFVGRDGELAGYERCLKLLLQLKPVRGTLGPGAGDRRISAVHTRAAAKACCAVERSVSMG